MTTTLYLITIILPCATVLLVFGIRALARIAEARARIAAESETTTALATIQTGVADLASRLASVEKILKDVG